MKLILALVLVSLSTATSAASCLDVATQVNQRLYPRVDAAELAQALRSLNTTHRLPSQFVSKREARNMGWQRGDSLWSTPALQGKSIGGDKFSNFERQLPAGDWREADLDYKGGHRGAKRLLFSQQGTRFVTVNHYQTYTEVPACL